MFETFRPPRADRRITIRLVVAIALASIATGVAAILTQPAVEADGSLGQLQSVAEFSGTVVGFALLAAAWGMRRGYRLAYAAAAVLVALAAAHGVVQFRALAVPLVVLSTGGLLALAATSRRFTRSVVLDATQVGAVLAIVGVFCYGTAGAYALRAQFDGVETVVDAVYFTAVTASTVGYGDVHAATETARLFAVSLVVLGPATLAATAGSLFAPLLETHFERTGRRAAAHLEPESGVDDSGSGAGNGTARPARVVALGFDATLAPVVEALAERASVAVVTDEETAPRLPEGAAPIVGDPTADRTLERAGLEACDAVLVVAAGIDAGETVAAARSYTDARIAVVEDRESRTEAARAGESLERAGADAVVDPAAVLADATVDALLGSDGTDAQSSASAPSHRG
ncbi:TrkA-N domain-containing protein [Haloterrigena salina JCM 13891]|uniref:TrkA-N domain-containing protein n=1 Tax=Haloterrigena salina JCM 13891 TaxID=1227488 RepID=M0C6R7_9EURY|nr:ion channel [Haloterrigena salina]ELZ18966.1 TrkA-N domain-containing protein [Haloterrigena salina JCM 13891]